MTELIIQFCERAVWRGQDLDRKVLGRPLSHPFLALVGSNGVVFHELHGTWSERCNSAQGEVGKRIESLLAASILFKTDFAVASMVRNSNHMPVNRVVQTHQPKDYAVAERKTDLVSGTMGDMLHLWDQLVEVGQKIDAQRFPYMRYAWGHRINCQKTLRCAMQELGFAPAELSLHLGSAGWNEDRQLKL